MLWHYLLEHNPFAMRARSLEELLFARGGLQTAPVEDWDPQMGYLKDGGNCGRSPPYIMSSSTYGSCVASPLESTLAGFPTGSGNAWAQWVPNPATPGRVLVHQNWRKRPLGDPLLGTNASRLAELQSLPRVTPGVKVAPRVIPVPQPRPLEAFPWINPMAQPIGRPAPQPRHPPRGALKYRKDWPTPDGTVRGQPSAPPRVRPGTPGHPSRPPAGVKERKAAITISNTPIGRILGFAGEVGDVLESFHRALPDEFRTPYADGSQMALDLWRHWHRVDMTIAISELISNYLEDMFYGKLGQLSQQTVARLAPHGYLSPVGLQSGGFMRRYLERGAGLPAPPPMLAIDLPGGFYVEL